jgi:YD repeat-containing protein
VGGGSGSGSSQSGEEPARGQDRGDVPMLQADFEDFEPLTDSGEEVANLGAQSMGAQLSSLVRQDRGGYWYSIEGYPGGEVNENESFVGEELQIYWYTGELWTLARIPKLGGGYTNRLAWKSDRNGNKTNYLYGASGKLIETRAGGTKTTYTSTSPTTINVEALQCSDAVYSQCARVGELYTYEYNTSGQLLGVEGPPTPYITEPSGLTPPDVSAVSSDRLGVKYEYNAQGKLWRIWITHGIGNQELYVEFGYYPNGQLESTTDAIGNTDTFTYPTVAGIRQVVSTNGLGDSEITSFDAHDRVVSIKYVPGPGRADQKPYSSVRVAYAPGDSCDMMVTNQWADDGTGEIEVLRATYEVEKIRMTSLSTLSANGNWLKEEYSDFTEGIDGNDPQRVKGPWGESTSIISFDNHTDENGNIDSNDSRFRPRGITVTNPIVTDIKGVKHDSRSSVELLADGRIALSVDADGLSTEYFYDNTRPQGLLERVETGPTGAGGQPDMSHPSAAIVRVERDWPYGRVKKTFSGDPSNPAVTEYVYDQHGVVSDIHSGKQWTKLYYSVWGDIAAAGVYAVDAAGSRFGGTGRDWYWSYRLGDNHGRTRAVISDIGPVTGADWDVTKYFYDSEGQLERTEDAFGRGTAFEYDGWGQKRVKRDTRTGPLLAERTISPQSISERVLVSDQGGTARYGTTTYNFHPTGALREVIAPTGHRVVPEYDLLGLVITLKGYFQQKLMGEMGSIYDEWGRPIQWTRKNVVTGDVTVLGGVQYNPFNLVAKYDRQGRAVNFNYDKGLRLMSVVNPLGTVSYEYAPYTGFATKEVQVSGSKRRVNAWDYDVYGRVTKAKNLGDGNDTPITSTYVYDSLGRATVTYPDGRSPKYEMGPDGRVWSYSFEGEGSVSFKHIRDIANGKYIVERTIAREGTRRFEFGRFGLEKLVEADGSQMTYAYSPLGYPASLTGRDGTVVVAQTDPLGRVVSSTVTNGSRVESYLVQRDAYDRVFEVSKTVGSRSWKNRVGFGDFSEVIWSEEESPGNPVRRTTLERKASDGVYEPEAFSGMTVGGVTWNYLFNGNDQLEGIDIVGGVFTQQSPLKAVRFGYDGATQNSMVFGNGVTTGWDYDERGLLSQVSSVKDGTVISSVQYERDKLGRITKQHEVGGLSKLGKYFDYVGDRLAGIKTGVSGWGTTYASTIADEETTISYDTQQPQLRTRVASTKRGIKDYKIDSLGRYSSIGNQSITYDSLDRIIKKGSTELQYDSGSLLPSRVLQNGSQEYSFEYAADGTLISSTDKAGVVTKYENKGIADLGEVDSSGDLKTAIVSFPGSPKEHIVEAEPRTGKVKYFSFFDSVNLAVAYDNRGEVIEKYETEYPDGPLLIADPNGRPRSSSAINNSQGFHNLKVFNLSSKEQIAMTPNRVLFVGEGIWNAKDPLGTLLNLFSFANNDPRKGTDATGGQNTRVDGMSGPDPIPLPNDGHFVWAQYDEGVYNKDAWVWSKFGWGEWVGRGWHIYAISFSDLKYLQQLQNDIANEIAKVDKLAGMTGIPCNFMLWALQDKYQMEKLRRTTELTSDTRRYWEFDYYYGAKGKIKKNWVINHVVPHYDQPRFSNGSDPVIEAIRANEKANELLHGLIEVGITLATFKSSLNGRGGMPPVMTQVNTKNGTFCVPKTVHDAVTMEAAYRIPKSPPSSGGPLTRGGSKLTNGIANETKAADAAATKRLCDECSRIDELMNDLAARIRAHKQARIPTPISPEEAVKVLKEKYGISMEVGKPSVIDAKPLRFTQSSVSSATSDGTILRDLADVISANPKKVNPIMIFVDSNGRVWSYDNRRLAATLLTDRCQVNAQLMSESRMRNIPRHFTTGNEGNSVSIFNENGELVEVIANAHL